MKASIPTLFLVLGLLVGSLSTQAQDDAAQKNATDAIVKALKTNDVTSLCSFLGDNVGLAIKQKAPVYLKKEEAKEQLDKFFESHKASNFTVAHSGGQGNAKFTVGDLTTNNGSYRVTFFLKEQNAKYLIQNLLFDAK